MSTPPTPELVAEVEAMLDSRFTQMETRMAALLEEKLVPRLERLESSLKEHVETAVTQAMTQFSTKLEEATKTVADHTKCITDLQAKFEDIIKTELPRLKSERDDLKTEVGLKQIEADMEKRKKSLIVSGIPGRSAEHEGTTRDSIIDFARVKLDIAQAAETHFLACHRLKRTENAPTLVSFQDSRQKETWVKKASLLRRAQPKMAITQDITPAVRTLRNDIYDQKKLLPDAEQKLYSLRYLSSWPFVQMKSTTGDIITPRNTKGDLVQNYLALNNY
jgi:hypothetical protein